MQVTHLTYFIPNTIPSSKNYAKLGVAYALPLILMQQGQKKHMDITPSDTKLNQCKHKSY